MSNETPRLERALAVVFAVVLVSSSAAGAVAGSEADGAGVVDTAVDESTVEMVEAVVVFEDFAARDAAVVRDVGGTVTSDGSVSILPVLSVRIPERAIDRLEAKPGVSFVERNHEYSVDEQTVPWGVDRVGGVEAAATVPDSAEGNVSVAVVDTGIDYDHPDLEENVVWGVNTVGSGSPEYGIQAADDDNGHGTFAAGIVAAADNDQGVVGVTPHARLYSVKALNESGAGTTMDVIEALDVASKGPDGVRGTEDDPDVVSMSFGSESDSQVLEDAIERASQSTVLVAAAGNSGDGDTSTNEVGYPARYDEVIAVAATEGNDETTTWSSEGSQVELAAPGSGVTSTYDGEYARSSGTSFAAPHVSGVAALLVADDLADGSRDVSDAEIRARLQETALDIEADGRDKRSGYGLVRADVALDVSDGSSSNAAPTIAVERPGDGATVNGTVEVRVDAADEEDARSDLDVAVAVDDGGWMPATYDSAANAFVVDWDTTGFAEDERHAITARVRDSDGATAKDTVDVVVDNENARPSIEFVSPVENETVGNATTIVLDASDAEDERSALEVAVAVDDGEWRTATYDDEVDRYRFEWDASTVAEDGTHVLRARVTDTDGATAEAVVNVSVDTTDDEPSVDLVAPENGSTVAGKIPILAAARDDRTTRTNLSVEYRVDDGDWRSLRLTDGRFRGRFDTLNVPDGPHAVTVRVSDGTHEVSERREITVANARVAATDELDVAATAETDDGNVTATFVATNAGDESKSVALHLTDVPDGWRTVSQESEGMWLDRRGSWVWVNSVEEGEGVEASITFAPAANASSTGTVGAVAMDQDDNRQGVTVTIGEGESRTILHSIAGEDGRVQVREVLAAIEHYNEGTAVPNTDGAVPTLEDVLRVIEYYNSGETVPQ